MLSAYVVTCGTGYSYCGILGVYATLDEAKFAARREPDECEGYSDLWIERYDADRCVGKWMRSAGQDAWTVEVEPC